jgi:hypothetical protein
VNEEAIARVGLQRHVKKKSFCVIFTGLILTVCIFKYVNNSKETDVFAQVHTSELEDTCYKSSL